MGSPSKILIENLLKYNKTLFLYDKLEEAYLNLGIDLNNCSTPQECVDNSDVVVIMHPDKDFSKLDFNNTEVIDLWGIKEY